MGFQTKLLPKSAYALGVDAFRNVSNTTNFLENFKAEATGNFRRNNFNIMFFNAEGSPAKIGEDETMRKFNKDMYNDHASDDLTFWTDREHWYLYWDNGKTTPMDKYPVAPGRGFDVYVGGLGENGVDFTCSGQVDDQDITLNPENSTYTLSGNMTPVDIALSNLVVETTGNLRRNNFNIMFFNAEGSPAKIGEDDTMKNYNKEMYDNYGTEDLTFWTDGSHWYLYWDNGKTIPVDGYPIVAGRGFDMYVGGVTGGVKLTIPSAIQDEKMK